MGISSDRVASDTEERENDLYAEVDYTKHSRNNPADN